MLRRHRMTHAGFALLALFAIAGYSGQAQFRVGFEGSLSAQKDADLNQEFELGTPSQREGLLGELGVDKAYVHEAATATPQTEIHVDQIEEGSTSLLFLPCAGPGSPVSHFYLLRLDQERHWRAVDSVVLDCWWKPTSYEFLPIKGRAGQAILAHHVNFGHGSGLVQDNMALFEVRGDHLAKVLDTQEYKSEDQTGGDRTVQQSSTLLAFPDGSLEETRITSVKKSSVEAQHATSLVERRRWHWSEKSNAFVATTFRTIPM